MDRNMPAGTGPGAYKNLTSIRSESQLSRKSNMPNSVVAASSKKLARFNKYENADISPHERRDSSLLVHKQETLGAGSSSRNLVLDQSKNHSSSRATIENEQPYQ